MRAKTLLVAIVMAALTGCAHDTQHSIREDAREKGQIITAKPADVVFGNMEAMFKKCLANWYVYRTFVNASAAPRPGVVATVALTQSAPTGTRVFLLVDVMPRDTGSEVTFYKSSAYSMFFEVRPHIEKWAKGDDLTC
jgi:hypothetical protein